MAGGLARGAGAGAAGAARLLVVADPGAPELARLAGLPPSCEVVGVSRTPAEALSPVDIAR